MTTGSRIDRIEATEGPTRARPAKKKMIAPTVLTRASVTSQAQAAGPASSDVGPPRRTEATAYVVAAPQHTRAVRLSGAMPESTRSPVRMYAV